jgi:hypothetical protein
MISDNDDKNASRKILIAVSILFIILGIGMFLLFPLLSEIIDKVFSPGLGLKSAAVISFFITTILMIVLTLVAGDGLIGEIQFVLGGFFMFFTIIWLMLAWIF